MKLHFVLLMGVLTAGMARSENKQDVPIPSADVKCVPAAQRGGQELGCYVLASQELGKLPDTRLYWHLHVYPTQAAAEAAKGKLGTVVESFGRVWLFAVAGASWNPTGGERISRVGPLPIAHGGSFTAEYMEATFMPGMKSRAHTHPGPEAWYVIEGEQCLETPGHKQVMRQGEGGFVPEGPPMVLWGTGKSKRQSLVLILHDTTRPMTEPAPDYTPAGLCAPG